MSDKIPQPPFGGSDLRFLLNEVLTLADTVMELSPGNPWTNLTCSEAEQFACIFAAAGRADAYHHVIHQHAIMDDAEEVEFHLEMMDGEKPPIPLGEAATDEAEQLRQALLVSDSDPEGGRTTDPSPVSYAPCLTGKVEIEGAVSEFMIPLDNGSVGFSQWGAPNEVLWSRVDLLDNLSGPAREWWADNRPEEDNDE